VSPQQRRRRRGTGKGPRQQRAEARERRLRQARARAATRRTAAIVLAAAVVLTTAGFAIFRGLGNPSVPDGDIAVVDGAPNGHISQGEFNATLAQEVPRLGLRQLPKPGSPQYAQVKNAAISDLLLQRWIEGEAADSGIVLSQSQVQDRLALIVKQQYANSYKRLDQQLLQLHLTNQPNCIKNATAPPPPCARAALERVRLDLLSRQIQAQMSGPGQVPTVSSDAARNYYETNIAQFQQPETRDFRLILNKSQAKVAQAAKALGPNPSPATWKKVAKQFSTDPTTKANGGLRRGVAKGQNEPALDSRVFSAPNGQLVGPFKGQSGWYLIEVEAVHPATTEPFSRVESQIQQQLQSAAQQQQLQSFQTDLVDKWTSRTFCAPGYVIDRCDNFSQPPTTTPGGAVVPSTKPVAPGQATVFFTQPQGLPQGPVPPGGGGGATAAPGGTPIPLGPGAAPPTGTTPSG
jgi:PPIC-type PPIASE domain/SurA N-terminal domain